ATFPPFLAEQGGLVARHRRGQRAVVARHPPPGHIVEAVERGHDRSRSAGLSRADRHFAVGECGPARNPPDDPAHRLQERAHRRPSHAPASTAAKPRTSPAATYVTAPAPRPSW